MNEELLQRLEALEARIRALEEQADGTHAPTAPTGRPAAWEPPHLAPPPEWPSPAPARTTAAPRNIELDSETVLKWGGVGLVVLAIGFAVSTAISRGWIGPGLQLAGAIALSLALIASGLRLEQERPAWTHALCTGGVLALFTTFASDLFLDQADDRIALAATVVSAVIGTTLALRVRSQWVGAATLFGAVIGWFTITDERWIPLGAAWATVLGATLITIATRHDWHAVRVATHATIGITVVGLAGTVYDLLDRGDATDLAPAKVAVLVAAVLVFASLARVPSIGDFETIWQQIEVQLVIGAAPMVLAVVTLSLELDTGHEVGASGFGVAAGSAVVAVGVRRFIHPAHFASQVIGASIVLSIALAALFDTDVVFAALAVQSAGLVVLARWLGDRLRVLVNAGVLALFAAVGTLATMIDAWSDDASVSDDVAHLVVIVALGVAVWQVGVREVRQLGALAVLGLTMVWTGSVLVHLPQGQAAVSVSWAAIGTAVLVLGAVRKRPRVGSVGLAVLAVTVGKLLTVDLQEVDALWRAALFLLIGLGLLRLGFLLPRLMGVDEPVGERGERDGDDDDVGSEPRRGASAQ